MSDYKMIAQLILDSNNIVFFGGAGVSTASNIPDFRSADGLYNDKANINYSPEQILSHSFFIRHTDDFYKFYKDKMIYQDALPNYAHLFLTKLENMNKLKAVITQNIDNLHQLAKTKNVIELHGSIYRNYCMKCHKFYDLDKIVNSNGIPLCECGGIIKPDVVLYEEGLNNDDIEYAIKLIKEADILIIGGTSLSVYPAASFIDFYRGNKMLLINKEKTPLDNKANYVFNEAIDVFFKNVNDEMEMLIK